VLAAGWTVGIPMMPFHMSITTNVTAAAAVRTPHGSSCLSLYGYDTRTQPGRFTKRRALR
jgi:hypothetical protein